MCVKEGRVGSFFVVVVVLLFGGGGGGDLQGWVTTLLKTCS